MEIRWGECVCVVCACVLCVRACVLCVLCVRVCVCFCCALNRKVAGSIPDGLIGIFH